MSSLKYLIKKKYVSDYLAVINSGSPISSPRVVKPAISSSERPNVQLVSSVDDIPIGVTFKTLSGNGDILRYGVLSGIDTSSQTFGNPVYFDASGNLVFAPNSVQVGTVIEVGVLGKILINVGGFGTGGGTGGGGSSSLEISQVNTFVKGDAIYYDAVLGWSLADASNINKIGKAIVTEAGSPDFTASLLGKATFTSGEITAMIGSASFTPGTIYYVSDSNPGKYTSLSPAISNPMFVAISATEVLIQPGFTASSNGGGESITEDVFVSTAGQTVFNLSFAPLGKSLTWLVIGGIQETRTAYTLSGNILTLNNPLGAGVNVSVKYVRAFKLDARNNIYPFRFTTTAGQTDFLLDIAPENENYLLVFVGGAPQQPGSVGGSYSLVNGNILRLDTPQSAGIIVNGIIINAVNFDVAVDNYITRKSVDLIDNQDILINSVSLFGNNLSGEYRIKVGNSSIGASCYLKAGVGGGLVQSNSNPDITNTFGTINKLNIDFFSNTIRIQNRLGFPIQLIVVREL